MTSALLVFGWKAVLLWYAVCLFVLALVLSVWDAWRNERGD